MTQRIDIYNCEKSLKSALNKLKEANISDYNKEQILKFHNSCIAEDISKVRCTKYIHMLKNIAFWLNKDFNHACNKEDIELFITRLRTDTLPIRVNIDNGISNLKKPLKTKFSTWTKHDYIVCLKKFYKWVNNDELPKFFKKIKARIKASEQEGYYELREGDLLTNEEFKDLLNATENPRDLALISFLEESGARIGEILNLRLKDLTFDDYGYLAYISAGKNKQSERTIRLVTSTPFMKAWIQAHPLRADKNSLVFITLGKKCSMTKPSHAFIYTILIKLFKKIGVNKKANPHSFRHRRAMILSELMTEYQLCRHLGWKIGSEVASVYVKQSKRSNDDAILKIHGIVKAEEKKKERICFKCQNINSCTDDYCNKCKSPLTIQASIKLQGVMENTNNLLNVIFNDEKILQRVKDILKEKKEELKPTT